ncbi:MAG: pyruvate carboxylase [Pirellulales bacterium]|nr:pyruvate carboxylase [Pirellulales bacterium]
MKPIRKLLVANRGEIAIRVFRSAHELGIRAYGIYSHEDRFALHRFKADEAYQVGRQGEPIRAYLDIDAILAIAKQHEIDAIHPGYGFLSENPELARACDRAGVIFVGPRAEVLDNLGDKIAARQMAISLGVPVLPGSSAPLTSAAEAGKLAESLGYPVLLKAAKGGGGRGMRVVREPDQLAGALEQAQRESLSAFGSSDVFLERYIARPRHIEVQLLGDRYGNLLHLYERDCSVQRRHQKVVEIAPAPKLDRRLRDEICASAVALGRKVGYVSAGTVEFLLDSERDEYYFIEVNPRIQVEHTVTEVVTGVDIVKSQLLIAQGVSLADERIGLYGQAAVTVRGFALQCRVTTEDPENGFQPDYGRISSYRSPGGMGVRLDAGTAFSGAVVTPFYDSLLVKVTTSAARFSDTAERMERCLHEFRVRGVKTNIQFLINLISHPTFLAGECTTRFIDETPELFQQAKSLDRATKILTYLADVIVNGNPLVGERPAVVCREPAPRPVVDKRSPIPPGTRDKFKQLGADGFKQWILDQRRLLITDTTMRDAHQSLLATRVRTHDMLLIAPYYAREHAELFSVEMWGGATFDTAMRFLKECPWDRLAQLREAIPNILFQMLLRASNAVGYANYPDNVVRAFVEESAAAGMDIFRVFDSLNSLPNMKVAIDAVLHTGALCEAAICYTGDLLDPARPKYDLKYYVDMAKELERMGAHLLAIKDMAGLCKPYAAVTLVRALKQEIGIPIHFHTHDTAGVQAAAILQAADVGLDIADAAFAPLSGLTSQPNLNSIVEALRFTQRETGLAAHPLQQTADYWEAVREFYSPFEANLKASTAEVYHHEMPGGQYTNLYQQAQAIGLGHRWHEVCKKYADVNQMLGDIVKVTPSSKAIGDMALFMVTNDLTVDDVLDPNHELAFPESIIDLVSGRMGKPPGGFPARVRARVLRGREQVKGRPGASMEPADLEGTADELTAKLARPIARRDVVSHLMFPRVFADWVQHNERYGQTDVLPTPEFFFGLDLNQEVSIDLEPGKALIFKYLAKGEAHAEGLRTIFFEVNGQPRSVTVQDRSLEGEVRRREKAEPNDPKQIGAPMPGLVVVVAVSAGDSVAQGQKLVMMEAMKMQTTLTAERAGRVAEVVVKPGTQVETGDLLLKFE